MRGRVVKWIDARGFGFVRGENVERDFFVHHSAIVGNEPFKTLAEGEPVEFELKPGPKDGRPIAAFVVRLNDAKAGK